MISHIISRFHSLPGRYVGKRIVFLLLVTVLPVSLSAQFVSSVEVDNRSSAAEAEDTGTTAASTSIDFSSGTMTVQASGSVTVGYGVTHAQASFTKNSTTGFGTDLTGKTATETSFTDTLRIDPADSSKIGTAVRVQVLLGMTGSANYSAIEGTSGSYLIFNSISLAHVDTEDNSTFGDTTLSNNASTLVNSTGDITAQTFPATTDSVFGYLNLNLGETITFRGTQILTTQITRSTSGQMAGGGLDGSFDGVFNFEKLLEGSVELDLGDYTFVTGSGTDYFNVSAVPEPASAGLLIGLGGLLVAGTRRRRKTRE